MIHYLGLLICLLQQGWAGCRWHRRRDLQPAPHSDSLWGISVGAPISDHPLSLHDQFQLFSHLHFSSFSWTGSTPSQAEQNPALAINIFSSFPSDRSCCPTSCLNFLHKHKQSSPSYELQTWGKTNLVLKCSVSQFFNAYACCNPPLPLVLFVTFPHFVVSHKFFAQNKPEQAIIMG